MTTRKASDVLRDLFTATHGGKTIKDSRGNLDIIDYVEAQATLKSDLLAMLPEKQVRTADGRMPAYKRGFNNAVDQMEQAIREYCGEDA